MINKLIKTKEKMDLLISFLSNSEEVNKIKDPLFSTAYILVQQESDGGLDNEEKIKAVEELIQIYRGDKLERKGLNKKQ